MPAAPPRCSASRPPAAHASARGRLSRYLAACLAGVLPLVGAGAELPAQEASSVEPAPGSGSWVWSVGSGLPINEVWDIEQTPDGYLWLATFAGLVRFDGRRFQVYSSSDYAELPSDRIESVRRRSDGSLLLWTEVGHLVAFDGWGFRALVPGSVADGRVTSLWEDRSGQVWIGLDDRDFGRLVGDRFEPALDGPPGWDVVRTVEIGASTWVGTRDGRLFSLGADGTRDRTPGADGGRALWTALFDLALGPDGRLFLATPEGIFRLDPAGGGVDRPSPVGGPGFSRSPEGATLVSEGTDAFRVMADGVPRPVGGMERGPALPVSWAPDGALWHVAGTTLFREGRPVTEVSGLVHDIFHDGDGSTWLATQSGLVQVTPNVFTSYQPDPAALRSACREMVCLPQFATYALAERADGSLLVGTLDFGTWVLGSGRPLAPVSPLPAFSLLVDDQAEWMGTFGGGVCRVGPSECVTPAGLDGTAGSIVRALARGPDGDVWVGAGPEVIRLRDGRPTRFGSAQGLPGAQVVSVLPTTGGDVWAGTFGGLARIRGGRAEVLRVADGLSSDVIRSLLRTEDGVIWAGTEGRGLNRIAGADGSLTDVSITRYTRRDGLLSDVIHTILDDGLGRLWMSSNDGIFWVRRDELEAFARGEAAQVHSVAYLERDGLANREANGGTQSAGLRASDGRLWFATMGGATVVDPAGVTAQSRPLSVLIESVTSGDEAVGPAAEVILSPGNRNLQIEYTAPAFRGVESLRFRYRMEGYDPDWVEVGDRRTAFYTNLPPGDLSFRVAAAGADGEWYEAAQPLQVSVTPLVYERPWFFPLLLAAGVGLAAVLVARRHAVLRARASDLSRLVSERTAQVEREKEESRQAQRAAEEAEAKVSEALEIVADQARRLRELDAAKSRLFANISHELRTPLTLTIGPLEDLRDELAGSVEEATMRGVDIALGNSRRLLRLVNQLLDVAKLEHGDLEIHPVMLDLAEHMRAVADAFGPLARRRGLTFRTEGLDGMLHATLDGDALEKILLNILSNAFKATPEGRTVLLGLEEMEEGARIVVRDEGTGIAPEILPRIFERFYQGAPGADAKARGTGIGLALVRELVELHGGTIAVDSEVGVGTTFTIDLPRVAAVLAGDAPLRSPGRPDLSELDQDEPAPPVAVPAEVMGDGQDARTTVLLVDDNADVRAYVTKHLADAYRVVEAEDGLQALALAEEAPPDLILADVMMPGMDGEELCRRVKSHPDLEFVPVVLLTAKASAESRVRALELGADDHIAKPFDKEQLRARLANLIDRSRRLRDRLRGVQIVAGGVDLDEVSPDERFLANVRRIILERMDDEDFGVEELAEALGQSRAHLYRRLGELHPQSPAELIKVFRLQRAAELLRSGEGTVSEVAYAVGFRSVSHFSRSFREAYGDTPSRFGRGEAERA